MSALSSANFTSLSGVTLLRSVPKPSFSSGSTWYLKLRVSPGSLQFEKYTNSQYTGTPEKIFDNIPIAASSSASGYGPFASFISHGCEVISSSSFDYFNITISPNTPPSIKASDVIINRGDPFSPMSGVTADDNEDGNLTSKVTITANNVNNNIPGIYNVTYTVSDILGLTATHTRKVTVLADVEFTVVDKNTKAPLSGIGIKLTASGSGTAPSVPDTGASGKSSVIVTPGQYSYEIVKGHPDYIVDSGTVSITVDSSASSTWPMPVQIELVKKVYDIGISLSVTNENAYKFNDIATFSMTVTNHGNMAVIPTISLMADTHIESSSMARAETGTVTLSAPLQPGKSEVVELPYKVTSLHAETDSELKAAVSGLKLADGTAVNDGNPDNNNAQANIRIVNPPVILYKVDAGNDNRLSGAQIKITNSAGETVYTGTSDKDGQFTVHGLLPGAYTVTELKPPSGYMLSKSNWTFQRAADSTISGMTKFPNEPTKLLVTNVEAGSKDRLKGGIFVLTDKNGKDVFKRTVRDKGEELLTNIAPGSYTLKQVQPPVGYILSKDTHTITVSETGEVSGISEIVNEPVIVTIVKTDPTKKPVEGSTVAIFNAKQEKIDEGNTDKDGKVIFTKLAPGKYTYKETKAPSSYVLNKKECDFEVKSDGSVIGDLTFENKLTEVTILKTDPDKKPLSGASIEVYDSTGKKAHEGVTDSDGKLVFKGIAHGKYTYREIKAPSGYALNKSTYSFEVKEDGSVTGDLVLINQLNEVIIQKTGPAKEAVAGASIEVNDALGRKIHEGVTDMSGKLVLKGIPQGNYTYREVKAPSTYALNTSTYSFAVDENGQLSGDLTFVDEYIKVEVMKVDRAGKPLAGAKFGLFDKTDKQVQTAVSGSDGMLSFTMIPLGEYQIRELEAPAGFALSGKAIKVDVTETFQNSKTPYTVENSPAPQTGVDGFPWWGILLLVISVLGLAGTGLFLWMKYKKS